MPRSRLLGATFLVVLVAGLLAAAAPAAPVRPASDQVLTTTHFAVHYYTGIDPTTDSPVFDYATQAQAGDIAAYAEQAYSLFTSWGFPAPVDDGDGHIDIYLKDFQDDYQYPSLEAYAQADNAGPAPSSGMIWLDTPTEMSKLFIKTSGLTLAQEEQKAVANELFVLFEFATWVPTNPGDYWLLDSAAQWAAASFLGYPAAAGLTTLGPTDIALDCRDSNSPLPPPAPALAFRMCDPDRFTELGYTRWAFDQLLANKFGTNFLTTALANGAAGETATAALNDAIGAKSGSLADVFTDYAVALMTGNVGVPALSTFRPTADATVLGGSKTATLPPVQVPVNHLSTAYVSFQRGDGDGSHPCYAATLTITVTMPSGTSSRPYFFWDVANSAPVALTLNGNTATAAVPWDTCMWGAKQFGRLSLPNASTTVDGATFTVASSLTVDPNTPAAPGSAPTGPTIWGTTVPVPTTDIAPLIDVFGPELLRLSATDPTIRLIVSSSGPGAVNATLGSSALGSRTLRAGNNDLRFVVPKGLFTRLRRSASAATLLTLTPMSTSGAVAGQAVTRHVSITHAAKKTKAKTKAKKHTK
jgi:hypothetical protein